MDHWVGDVEVGLLTMRLGAVLVDYGSRSTEYIRR
jgi:hypothetical protein